MPNNFIYAKTKDLFEEHLNSNNISDETVAFIEDTKEIWNHNTYFGATKVSLLENDANYIENGGDSKSGLYVATQSGKLLTINEYKDSTNETPVGIALVDPRASFIMGLTYTSGKRWGTEEQGLYNAISSIYNAKDGVGDETDFKGVANTNAIVNIYSGTDCAAGWCRSLLITFGDLTLSGYLGAAGEWELLSLYKQGLKDIMTAVGNKPWNPTSGYGYCWSSTQANNNSARYAVFSLSTGPVRIYGSAGKSNTSTNYYSIRSIPFFPLTLDASHSILEKLDFLRETKGSITSPIYIKDGFTHTTYLYAGGTNVSLNSRNYSGKSLSFYAPTSSGKEGLILVSKGDKNTPVWEDPAIDNPPADGEIYGRKNNTWVKLISIEPNYKDLSKYDIHGNAISNRNTANCYVVKETGGYKIPLVYGNAIKNGEINSIAYTNNGGSNSHDFVNYKGVLITNPYIETDTGETVESAQLSITDTDDVITNVSISHELDGAYVKFVIRRVPDTGANGVISIKNSEGTIMWSWHIWVWKDDLTPVTITNYAGVNYNILPVNLASKWLTDSSNPTRIISWVYQWGRPTPLAPITGYNNEQFTLLYGILYNKEMSTADYYYQGIQNPTIAYDNSHISKNWFNSYLCYNLWDQACTSIGCSDNNVIKTIYDPCPLGFKIPNGNIFTGFTKYGTTATKLSDCNVVGSYDRGHYFKKNNSDTTGIFFPALGNGDRSWYGTVGGIWLSAVHSSGYSYILYFGSSSCYPNNNSCLYNKYSVRPVVDN